MADIKQSVVTEVVINNKQATKAINDQEKAQDKLTESTNESSKATEQAEGAIDNMASSLGLNLGAMKKTVGGLSGVVKGMKTLKGAIAATGIGLLVLALVGLVSWFKRTEEGGDKLSVIMSGVGGVMEGLLDVVGNLGKIAFEVLVASIKIAINVFEVYVATVTRGALFVQLAWAKLSGTVEDVNSINEKLIENNEKIVQSGKEIVDTVKDATKEIILESKALVDNAKALKDKADQSIALQKIENDLNRLTRKNTVAEAKRREEIQKNILVTRDFNKSFEDRRAALNKANELEQTQLEESVRIAETQFKLAKERDAISDSDKTSLDGVAQAEANLINVRTQSLSRQKELQNRITEQNNKQDAELKALQATKDAVEASDKLTEDARIKRIDDAELKLVLAREKEAARKAEDLESARLFEEELTNIETAKFEREKEAANGHKAELELIEFDHQTRLTKIKEKAAVKEEKLKKAEIKGARISAEQQLAISGGAVSELGGLIKDNAVSSAVINIANGVTAALALGPVGIPTIPGIIATGLAQLGIIKSVETVKAEDGMMIQGASHLNGGVNVMTPNGMIEAEGGEFIMNKLSTAMFKDELSAISQAGGGVPLAQRGLLIEGASSSSSLRNLSSDISGTVNGVQTVLVTEDLTAVQSRVSVTEQISTL